MGTFKNFQGFNDEDKYLKLTKRQWVIILLGVFIAIPIIRITYATNIVAVGIFLSIMIGLSFTAVALIPLPIDKYLWGGGNRMEVILLRVFIRKFIKREVYVKNYETEVM